MVVLGTTGWLKAKNCKPSCHFIFCLIYLKKTYLIINTILVCWITYIQTNKQKIILCTHLVYRLSYCFRIVANLHIGNSLCLWFKMLLTVLSRSSTHQQPEKSSDEDSCKQQEGQLVRLNGNHCKLNFCCTG